MDTQTYPAATGATDGGPAAVVAGDPLLDGAARGAQGLGDAVGRLAACGQDEASESPPGAWLGLGGVEGLEWLDGLVGLDVHGGLRVPPTVADGERYQANLNSRFGMTGPVEVQVLSSAV